MAEARLGEILAFRLVTRDPARLLAFFRALGFEADPARPLTEGERVALGLDGGGERTPLRLGASRIDIDRYEEAGAPYPAGANAADLVFQHLALVTPDAHAAWRAAEAAGALPISRDGPVLLPPSSGGVTAVKFRDPDGHPLELLQFPPGARPEWAGQGLVLGIDHSAISVADGEASRRFYSDRGLQRREGSLNQGPTQVALDGLDNVVAEVSPLKPPAKAPSHLELLAYRRPEGRPHPPLAVTDVAATRIVWRADERSIFRDPDGHIHELAPG